MTPWMLSQGIDVLDLKPKKKESKAIVTGNAHSPQMCRSSSGSLHNFSRVKVQGSLVI